MTKTKIQPIEWMPKPSVRKMDFEPCRRCHCPQCVGKPQTVRGAK